MNPLLTIVIPSRNSAGTIGACLESVLSASSDGSHDVIVVDNGSTDATPQIVRRYPVRLETIAPGFVSRSRNIGAGLARSALVAFVDSDCVVLPGWHAAVVAALEDPAAGIVGCRHEGPENGTWVQRAWNRAHARQRPAAQEVVYVPAGNMAARTEVFAGVGGFDETLETGEDPDLCARVAARGLRVLEVPGMRCIHYGEPATLAAVFRRERWHGRGARLRYGDGRLAPIMLTSLAFGIAALSLPLTLAWAFAGGDARGVAASLVAAASIPSIYSARYAKGLWHAGPLLLVYTAYFAGRAAALGVALRRGAQQHPLPTAHDSVPWSR